MFSLDSNCPCSADLLPIPGSVSSSLHPHCSDMLLSCLTRVSHTNYANYGASARSELVEKSGCLCVFEHGNVPMYFTCMCKRWKKNCSLLMKLFFKCVLTFLSPDFKSAQDVRWLSFSYLRCIYSVL